jgi:hypothetical protein
MHKRIINHILLFNYSRSEEHAVCQNYEFESNQSINIELTQTADKSSADGQNKPKIVPDEKN